MAEICTRLMTQGDVDAVHAIEEESFALPWSRAAFLTEVTENRCARYLVLTEDGLPVAYAGCWFVIDEGHITNIAVKKDKRGRGYGEAVSRALVQLAANSGVRYMTLEVRKGNAAARALYKKLGFFDVGLRKGYYEDNREDAVIMCLDSLPEPREEEDPFLIREA